MARSDSSAASMRTVFALEDTGSERAAPQTTATISHAPCPITEPRAELDHAEPTEAALNIPELVFGANDGRDPLPPAMADEQLRRDATSAGWAIAEFCGAGRFAKVYRAVHKDVGVTRALKCIDRAAAGVCTDACSNTLSLVSERSCLLSIGYHPHIVVLHGHFETVSAHVLVLEFVAHGNLLEHLLERGPVAESTASAAFRQICGALAHVHGRGFVHRDVKPENMLLRTPLRDARAQIALTDFGLSRDYAGGCFTVVGTPAYMAPEVLVRLPLGGASREGYGAEVDLWALGVSLYVTLAAEPPFDDSSLYEQVGACSYEFDGPVWREISFCCQRFVRLLINPNKASRLTAPQALRSIWLSRTTA